MSVEEIKEEIKDRLDKFAALGASLDQNEALIKWIREEYKDDPKAMKMVEEAERNLAESRKHLALGRTKLEPFRKLFDM